MATEAIMREEMHWYSDQPWYVVELQQRAKRGPVEVTGVSTENPGFVGCTEISYLGRRQLVAELDKALSVVQPIRRHGCHVPQDGQPGQRTCLFVLHKPALLGHCGAEVVVEARECRRYCFKLDGRELVLTCCWLFAVCGICPPPSTSDNVMFAGKGCHSLPFWRYSYVLQNFMFVGK